MALQDMDKKTYMIWESLKSRLGSSESEDMIFNLNELLFQHLDLSRLEVNFTKEEIDGIIVELPSDKSLDQMVLAMSS
jgi:transcriptional regulator